MYISCELAHTHTICACIRCVCIKLYVQWILYIIARYLHYICQSYIVILDTMYIYVSVYLFWCWELYNLFCECGIEAKMWHFLSLFAMQEKNRLGYTQCENVDARITSQQFFFVVFNVEIIMKIQNSNERTHTCNKQTNLNAHLCFNIQLNWQWPFQNDVSGNWSKIKSPEISMTLLG